VRSAKTFQATFLDNLWFNLIGSTVHNMMKEHHKNNQSFQEIVEKGLLPALLNYFNVHPHKEIIWMLQNPSTDLLGPITSDPHNIIIHVKKIHDYNNIIMRIFKYWLN
jgi:hypothetical protein